MWRARRRGVNCGGSGGGGRGWLGVAEGRATPAPSRGAGPPPAKIKPSRCFSFVAFTEHAPSATILLQQPNKLCQPFFVLNIFISLIQTMLTNGDYCCVFTSVRYVLSKTRAVSSEPTCRFWVCVGDCGRGKGEGPIGTLCWVTVWKFGSRTRLCHVYPKLLPRLNTPHQTPADGINPSYYNSSDLCFGYGLTSIYIDLVHEWQTV